MLVVFSEQSGGKWWQLRYLVETYDKVLDEYTFYRNLTWLEMVFLLRYFRRQHNATINEASA